MELFTRLFGHLLAFVYHCLDRIVIHGYLTRLSRPEHVVYFFHEVIGAAVITKEILSERTNRYQNWVGRDRDTARATLGQGLAVSAFPRYVPTARNPG